jgi:protein SCO1/2
MRPGVCLVYVGPLIALVLCSASCSRSREYELRGQVLAVDASRLEVTVKHDDIPGFMPGMTMAFKVRKAGMLEGRKAGDLIRATLVVQDADAYLKKIESTGHAPPTETPPAPRVRVLSVGDPLPEAVFVDESGRSRRLADWRGQAIALTFIYTQCPVPNFCPLMDRQFAEVQASIKKDVELSGRVHLLSISFDPVFDTPAVLAAHAKKVGADPAVWNFMTGDRADVERFASHLGMSIVPDATSAPEIVHNLRTAVIGPDGRLVKIFNGSEWSAADLISELRNVRGGG